MKTAKTFSTKKRWNALEIHDQIKEIEVEEGNSFGFPRSLSETKGFTSQTFRF